MVTTYTPVTYRFTLEELNIEVEPIYKLMGFDPDDVHEPFPEMIQNELAILAPYCNIQGGYVLVEPVELQDKTIIINGVTFEVGKKVTRYLKNSQRMALFTCTAGEGISARSKQFMDNGDMLEGYITDVIGSVIVETAMDRIHNYIKNEYSLMGENTTNRYSPGYCNWSVGEQFKLFSFLPDNFCNVSLSESALMHPIKSVSGFIGLGTDVKFIEYLCDNCNSTNCIYRNLK